MPSTSLGDVRSEAVLDTDDDDDDAIDASFDTSDGPMQASYFR